MKEIVIDEMIPETALKYIDELSDLCNEMLRKTGNKRQNYYEYWTRGYDKDLLHSISYRLETLVEYAQYSKNQLLITKLMDYPIIRNLYLYRPTKIKSAGILLAILFPISVPIYLFGSWQQKGLRRELNMILSTNKELKEIIHKDLEPSGKKNILPSKPDEFGYKES